jgi:hypothetical protein
MPDHSTSSVHASSAGISPADPAASRAPLNGEQLEDLQTFLKDWLRHQGRTQADLRRALRAESIRMPVLLDTLQQLHAQGGLSALAARLCGIEDLWQQDAGEMGDSSGTQEISQSQLDLLLEEIRQDQRV